MRVRGLIWLIAFVALVWPPSFGVPYKAMAHDAGMPMTALTGCDHAPPPPCPMNDSAKHAAGTCCPAMSGAVALLADEAPAIAEPVYRAFVVSTAIALSGINSKQDPPPPRA